MKEKEINLEKYQGKWWEIAKKPTIFQITCLSDTNANYTLKEDYVEVENKCKGLFGIPQSVKGKAFFSEKKNTLQVQFSPLQPKFDNYIVEWVDKDYQNTLVGSPTKTFLWFLSRNKKVSDKQMTKFRDIAISKGYDLSNLQITKQSLS